jgi:hypothetical protein
LKIVLKLEYPFGFFYSVDFTQNHFVNGTTREGEGEKGGENRSPVTHAIRVADTMFYACALYLLCIIPQHSWS